MFSKYFREKLTSINAEQIRLARNGKRSEENRKAKKQLEKELREITLALKKCADQESGLEKQGEYWQDAQM